MQKHRARCNCSQMSASISHVACCPDTTCLWTYFSSTDETADQPYELNVRSFIRVYSANLFHSNILHINADSQKTKKKTSSVCANFLQIRRSFYFFKSCWFQNTFFVIFFIICIKILYGNVVTDNRDHTDGWLTNMTIKHIREG